MKKGDFVNMYNIHYKGGRPDHGTLCGKGILIKPCKSKLKHDNDGWDEFERSKEYWTHWVTETQKTCDKILENLSRR